MSSVSVRIASEWEGGWVSAGGNVSGGSVSGGAVLGMAGLSVSDTGSEGGDVVGGEVGAAVSAVDGEGDAVSWGSPSLRRQELNIIRASIINIAGINPRLNIVFNSLSFLSRCGNT